MRAHQIMTHPVITVTADASIVTAAKTMLTQHVSGLPVVNDAGQLVGIITEGDFVRRKEIGTQRRHNHWLRWFITPGRMATDFVHDEGRKVGEIMSLNPFTVGENAALEEIVELMEKKNVKRLPVVQDGKVTGIVTRSNLLQAVCDLARDTPDPTADDDHIRKRIIQSVEKYDWRPLGLGVVVRNGIVHLRGVITDERSRQAMIVATENISGVKQVHDHLCWVDIMTGSGAWIESPEDHKTGAVQ